MPWRVLTLLPLLVLYACHKPGVRDFRGDDRLRVDAALEIRKAIEACHSETSDYPADIRAAEQYLTPGTKWPNNPYTHTPIVDNGSNDFDPAKSSGTIHYETYKRTGAEEQIAGYRLHVFGKTGRLMVFDNSSFGAQ